ncbi:hypothetical protein [Noviherbaspirillum sp.]|uniref:hypothetical protein n=1 Tax=Noviherbaspirillum sp. TaxID=1926288 RepID=UPI002D63FD3B|nr:hypothetical protein [Noviherbaspirillum sp.]HZW20238.1 hypothetical protein [Noviherbaspirillum sp.]
MSKANHRKGMLPFQFVAIPVEIIRSAEWQALPSSAKALAVDLMAQYSGKNNGRLCTSFEVMYRDFGWVSKETLVNAKRALLGCSFVVLTRKGHAPRTAEWIGFTWWKLDYEESMDIDPRRFPYLNFLSLKRLDPNDEREVAKPGLRVVRKPN